MASSPVSVRRRVLPRSPEGWRAAALLALPFLAGVIGLRGLTHVMPTFHAGDELTYHLPTIEQFARQLWTPDLVHYPAAQTPLFHLLIAAWSRVVGLELWRLRVVEVLISYGVALMLYRLLRRYCGLRDGRRGAAGGAVRLLALRVRAVVHPRDRQPRAAADAGRDRAAARVRARRRAAGVRGRVRRDRAGAADAPERGVARAAGVRGAACCTCRETRPRTLAGGLVLLGLAALPLLALVLAWHGLVPPTADPASCGLCSPAEGRLGWAGDSRLRAPLYAIAIAAVYGTLLHGPALWDELRAAAGGAPGGCRSPPRRPALWCCWSCRSRTTRATRVGCGASRAAARSRSARHGSSGRSCRSAARCWQ